MNIFIPGHSGSYKDLFLLQQGRCALCDDPMDFDEATRDHVVPQKYGGTWQDGMQLAHVECNRIRGCDLFLNSPMYYKNGRKLMLQGIKLGRVKKRLPA